MTDPIGKARRLLRQQHDGTGPGPLWNDLYQGFVAAVDKLIDIEALAKNYEACADDFTLEEARGIAEFIEALREITNDGKGTT